MPVEGAGTYDVEFANVDDRLTLWVDGRTPFGDGPDLRRRAGRTRVADRRRPRPGRRSPTRGATVAVSDLVLKRDIYYTQYPGDPITRASSGTATTAADRRSSCSTSWPTRRSSPASASSDADDYRDRARPFHDDGRQQPAEQGQPGLGLARRLRRGTTSTARVWEVPRTLLTGKAFFVYWPHGKPFGPDIRLSRDFRLPFRPYFERMKWIR